MCVCLCIPGVAPLVPTWRRGQRRRGRRVYPLSAAATEVVLRRQNHEPHGAPGEVPRGVRRVCRQGPSGALVEGLAIQAITLPYLKCSYMFMLAMFLSKIIVFVCQCQCSCCFSSLFQFEGISFSHRKMKYIMNRHPRSSSPLSVAAWMSWRILAGSMSSISCKGE